MVVETNIALSALSWLNKLKPAAPNLLFGTTFQNNSEQIIEHGRQCCKKNFAIWASLKIVSPQAEQTSMILIEVNSVAPPQGAQPVKGRTTEKDTKKLFSRQDSYVYAIFRDKTRYYDIDQYRATLQQQDKAEISKLILPGRRGPSCWAPFSRCRYLGCTTESSSSPWCRRCPSWSHQRRLKWKKMNLRKPTNLKSHA